MAKISRKTRRNKKKTISKKFSRARKSGINKKSVKNRKKKIRRESIGIPVRRESVNSSQKGKSFLKTVTAIYPSGKLNLKFDKSFESRTELKKEFRRLILKASKSKKLKKIKTGDKFIIRVLFKDQHKKKIKERRENRRKYNSKKHQIAVSTPMVDVNDIEELINAIDFLFDYVQEEIEKYLKYTEKKDLKALSVDCFELSYYDLKESKEKKKKEKKKNEKHLKKNQNGQKTKRKKKVRRLRR